MPDNYADLLDDLRDALHEADEALMRASGILHSMDADVAEDPRCQRIRRIREDIGELEDRIENE